MDIDLSSSFNVFTKGNKYLAEKKFFVSSTNRTNLRRFDDLMMSFMYNKKSRGPNVDPYGTPALRMA